MDEKYILSIDQSTSGTKATLFDKNGKLRYRANTTHKQYYPNPGWVEHDPKEIMQRTYEAISKLIKEANISTTQIAAIGISNQRETSLIWNKKTGEPIYNAIVWQCQRASEICKEIEKQNHSNLIYAKTGLVLSPYFPAAKIKWILDNIPDARKKAELGELVFGTIDSWLIWNLTGGKVHATDYSNASRTQLYNIYEKKWDPELMKIFTIPENMAPEVCDSNHIFGYTLKSSIFDREIPICGVIGDSHAALFGQNCFEKGMTKVTYGTGSSIVMNIGESPLASKHGLVTSIGWSIDGEVEYIFEGNVNCTGDTIKWLVDEAQLIPDASVTEEMAKSLESNDGVYFVPAFVGLGAPYWDSEARALITGLSRGSRKEHIVRAALEAIAYQIKDVVDIMADESDTTIKEIRVDGGPTKNNFLMQFQSDMLGVPVVCAQIEELSAAGAAYMAGLAQGFWSGKEELKMLRKTGNTFCPNIELDKRNELYKGWKIAIRRALTQC